MRGGEGSEGRRGEGGGRLRYTAHRIPHTFASRGRDNLLWLCADVVHDGVDEPGHLEVQPLLLHLGGHTGVPAEDDSSVAWLHWREDSVVCTICTVRQGALYGRVHCTAGCTVRQGALYGRVHCMTKM